MRPSTDGEIEMPAPSNSFENGSIDISVQRETLTNENSVTHWSCASHMTPHVILAGKPRGNNLGRSGLLFC